MDYVAGYTVVHDVSARDWQLKKNSGQWLIGKTFDSFCPIGPAIVTKDSLSGTQNVACNAGIFGAAELPESQLIIAHHVGLKKFS